MPPNLSEGYTDPPPHKSTLPLTTGKRKWITKLLYYLN